MAKLHSTVDRTNAALPDVICILGDLVIQGGLGGRFVPPEEIVIELTRLPAPGEVVAVLGNHDGWFDHDRVRQALETIGIRVVEDTAIHLDTPAGLLWVAGISDLWARRHDLSAALAAVADGSSPVLLLTHNPDIFRLVPDRVTLTLAGHTHGGQVRLPFAGAVIVPSEFGQRFAAGHVVESGRHLFVATRTGNKYPARALQGASGRDSSHAAARVVLSTAAIELALGRGRKQTAGQAETNRGDITVEHRRVRSRPRVLERPDRHVLT